VVPTVGRFSERVVYRLLVPLDSREGILVLVLHAEHVSELMECGTTPVGGGKVPAVHSRRLIQGDVEYFAADRRSGASIGRRVADPDFTFAEFLDLLKHKADSDVFPFVERVTDGISLNLWN
jgi:hypothetical protein